jgi:hypothetical protein
MPDRQKTTNYFSHDSNARNDEKLVRLRMRHGAAGYGVYFMLLERLREENNYTSVRDYNMIAYDLRVDASLVKSVVEDFGLFAFAHDGKCFYSESFSRRMEMMDTLRRRRSHAGKLGMASRWEKQPRHLQASSQAHPSTPSQQPSPQLCPAQHQPHAGDDDKWLQLFFRKENSLNLKTLLMSFGLQPDATPLLRSLAEETVSEWKISGKQHADYTDFSQHLIATMRIKAGALKAAKTSHPVSKLKPNVDNKPKPDDYSYRGGFGSEDI